MKMEVTFRQIEIPWTGSSALEVESVRHVIATTIGSDSSRFLAEDLHVAMGLESTEADARVFLQAVAAQLAREFAVWSSRLEELDVLGLMTREEAAKILARTR